MNDRVWSPKILVVYPHNFMSRNSGINSRYYELMKYFTRRGFSVDLLGLSNFVDSWPESGKIGNHEIKVDNLFLYDFKRGRKEADTVVKNIRHGIGRFFRGQRSLAYSALPDFAFRGMRRLFDTLVSRTHYDFILISYAYWAGLIEGRDYPNTTSILEISDFLTLNLSDAEPGRVDVGTLLNEELRRVNLFERVFCISGDELSFFSRLAARPTYYYVPHFMPQTEIVRDVRDVFTADVCIVASDNPHNIKGIKWFYDQVMPLLPDTLRYTVVGRITGHVPFILDNVTTIPYVEDLSEIYNKSRISICPLLGGTGMKIKVVEALAHGLPVVCTRYGVIGFRHGHVTGCTVADSAEDFAAAIRVLIADPEHYREQCRSARNFFLQNFEEACVYRKLDDVFAR
ncbi:MAG: glycosyltransferase [Thermodesulfovibrionales bacterium]